MNKLIAGTLVIFATLAISMLTAIRTDTALAGEDSLVDINPDPLHLSIEKWTYNTENSSTTMGSSYPDRHNSRGHSKPFLGIIIGPLSQTKAQELGIFGGVVVTGILDMGPSAHILRDGDVVIALNGETVSEALDVVLQVRKATPGEVVTLTVVREEQTLNVDITLGERKRVIRKSHIPAFKSTNRTHLLKGLKDGFTRSEIVRETADGFKTVSAVLGMLSEVDVDQGTFTLVPKDSSEPIKYTISDDTLVNPGHRRGLGELNTNEEVLIVSVSDSEGEKVKLLLQEALKIDHPFHKGPLINHKNSRRFSNLSSLKKSPSRQPLSVPWEGTGHHKFRSG